MDCPFCRQEMREGGLIANGVGISWVDQEQFQRKGLKRLLYVRTHLIGKTNYILQQTRVPGAFFCERCNKVIGFFDVTNNIGGV